MRRSSPDSTPRTVMSGPRSVRSSRSWSADGSSGARRPGSTSRFCDPGARPVGPGGGNLRAPPQPLPDRSDVEVPVELVRVRPQVELQLLLPLDLPVRLEDRVGEGRGEELVVGGEAVERLAERAGQLPDPELLAPGRRELVDVLVDRGRRLDLLADAVEA